MPFFAPKVMVTQIERLVVCQWDDAPTKGWQQAAAQVGAQLALGGVVVGLLGTHMCCAWGAMGRGQRLPSSLVTQHPTTSSSTHRAACSGPAQLQCW